VEGGAQGGETNPAALDEILVQLSELSRGVQGSLENIAKAAPLKEEMDVLLEILAEAERRSEAAQEVYISEDKTSILIFVRPRLPSQESLAYNRKVTQLIWEIIKTTNLKGFSVGLTGSYVYSSETDRAIQADMRMMTIVSSIAIGVILFLAFGHLLYSFLVVIPLLMGLILTLTWAKLTVGGLNLITSFLPALILGLGIDYGVHFIARYIEERKTKEVGPALKATIIKKGSATLIAALTTSFVFLGLALSRSRGLYEMGLIASGGIIFSFLMMLFVLPALLITFNPKPKLHTTLLPLRSILRGKKVIIIATMVLTLATAFVAVRVEFEFVSEELIPENLQNQLTRKRIEGKFDLEEVQWGDFLVFFAKSRQEHDQIVKGLWEIDLVRDVRSITTLLPEGFEKRSRLLEGLNLGGELEGVGAGIEVIEENLGLWDEVIREIELLIGNLSSLQLFLTMHGQGSLSVELGALQGQLIDLMDEMGTVNPKKLSFDIADLKGRISLLKEKFEGIFGYLKPGEIPQDLKEQFFTKEGEYVIYAYLSPQVHQEYQRFIREISKISDDYLGKALIGARLEEHMRSDFVISTALALLIILGLLWWSGKGISHLLAMLPLILGYVWMLGLMKLLSIEFNFTNIIISPLLIGIGVDNGIHLIHRYLEDRKLEATVRSTALPILTTSLTTLVVFASLFLASTPGLRMLGVSALIGIGFTTVFTLILLPAILALKN
jgi:hypothetical protein